MNKTTLAAGAVVSLAVLLSACAGPVDRYEAGVQDYEPVYCYKTLAAIECHRAPKSWDERRLVNYYGPHPGRYDRPEEKAPRTTIVPPPPVDYYVRDPDPIPAPAVTEETAVQPWKAAAASETDTSPETGSDEWLRAIKDAVGTGE